MTEEEKEDRRAKEKERIALKRSLMTEEEKEKMREKDRARKAKSRPPKIKKSLLVKESVPFERYETRKPPTLEDLRRQRREAQSRLRTKRNDEEAEYVNIENLLLMRKLRETQNGKEHLLANLEAKRGMRAFWEEGRLKDFEERKFRDIDEETIWRKFWKRSKLCKDVLKVKKPDLASKLLEEEKILMIEREEKKKKEKALEKAGIWEENPASGEMIWTGKNPPPEDEAAYHWGGGEALH